MMLEYLHIGKAADLTKRRDRYLYRFFEMLPGMLSWTTLLAVFFCSFWFPGGTALFIVVFDTYWLVKTIYLSLHLRYGYSQTKKNLKIDWLARLDMIHDTGYAMRDIYHLIILPTYKEGSVIVGDSLDSLSKTHYPQDRMIVVLALEARAGKEFNDALTAEMQERFGTVFFKFIVTQHPDGIVGEMAGKGANTTHAAREVKANVIDPLNIPYANIMVSVFDVDTVVYPEYFGRLTYVFLTTPDPLRASYQPIPFFVNNIWDAPAFARVVAFSSTFWQTIQQERPENLITFSSHSMPFQAVVDIGFWQTNMVSEDSRVFWQCLLRYDGNYRVVPLYYPVALDANAAPTLAGTVVSVYKQHRRWGYGAENMAYFLFGFTKNKLIPRTKKLFYTLVIGEGYWSWATNAIMLFVLGWLPRVVGGPNFNHTVLSFNQGSLTNTITRLALFALLTPALMSLYILPPHPKHIGRLKHSWMLIQWILFPFTTIIFGALPGLEAQTRLMLGRYMGFWITPKHRRNAVSSD